MTFIEAPTSVESLLELQSCIGYEFSFKFQCLAHHEPPPGQPTSTTICVLERGHGGLHQGVQMFTTVRAIAWDGAVGGQYQEEAPK